MNKQKLFVFVTLILVFVNFFFSQDRIGNSVVQDLERQKIIYENLDYPNKIHFAYVLQVNSETNPEKITLTLVDLHSSNEDWHRQAREHYKTKKLPKKRIHSLVDEQVKVTIISADSSSRLYYDGANQKGELAKLLSPLFSKNQFKAEPDKSFAEETQPKIDTEDKIVKKKEGERKKLLLRKKQNKSDKDNTIRELKNLIKILEEKINRLIQQESSEKNQLEKKIKELEQKIDEISKKKANPNVDVKKETKGLRKEMDKAKAQIQEILGGIQFSGFFDVSGSTFEQHPNIFALGDFEFDLEKSFGDNFAVGGALVFNDDGAELAVGFIDYHIFGGSVSARGRLFNQKGLHFQIGRYDIPFGNDWQYFASVDRLSVSAPLTTEIVMDGGYNDVGLRILRSNISYNLTLYVLQGIEEGISFGGRFGFTPFNNPYTMKEQDAQQLDLGFSYFRDIDRDGNREETAIAIDFESVLGPVRIQGEYISHVMDLDNLTLNGFHISLFTELEEFLKLPVTLFARYDTFTSNHEIVQEKFVIDRVSFGLHFNLYDISILKFEYNRYLKDNEEFAGGTFFAQLVITF